MTQSISKIKIIIALAILSLFLVKENVSAGNQVIASHTDGSVTVKILSSKSAFQKGNNRFELEFTENGSAFDAGKAVKLHFYMPAMPPTMPEMRDDAKIRATGKTGIYKGRVRLQMSGSWQVNISYGSGKTMSFDIIAE